MSEPRPQPRSRHRAGAPAALLAVLLLLAGCASAPRRHGDLAPIGPATPARLETAPPAARDALEAGLRWIAADAPRTGVVKKSPTHPPSGGGR